MQVVVEAGGLNAFGEGQDVMGGGAAGVGVAGAHLCGRGSGEELSGGSGLIPAEHVAGRGEGLGCPSRLSQVEVAASGLSEDLPGLIQYSQ